MKRVIVDYKKLNTDTENYDCVKSYSLNDIIKDNRLSYIDFIKLDCEGSEYDILPALDSKYYAIIKEIRMEYHAVPGGDPSIIESLLISKGYRVIYKSGYDNSGHLWFNNYSKQ